MAELNLRIQIVNVSKEIEGIDERASFILPVDYGEVERALGLVGFPNCHDKYRIVSHHTVDDFLHFSERPSIQNIDEWNELYYMLKDLFDEFENVNEIQHIMQELRFSVKGFHSLRHRFKKVRYSDEIVEELFNKYGRENVCISTPYCHVLEC